jgi:phage shock protein E
MKITLIIISIAIVLGVAWQVLGNKNIHMKKNEKNIDLVLDVRTVDEWNAGHGTSAKNIPVDELSTRVAELSEYKNKNVVVVCRSGARAGMAIEVLKRAGFTNLENGGPWQNYAAN